MCCICFFPQIIQYVCVLGFWIWNYPHGIDAMVISDDFQTCHSIFEYPIALNSKQTYNILHSSDRNIQTNDLKFKGWPTSCGFRMNYINNLYLKMHWWYRFMSNCQRSSPKSAPAVTVSSVWVGPVSVKWMWLFRSRSQNALHLLYVPPRAVGARLSEPWYSESRPR